MSSDLTKKVSNTPNRRNAPLHAMEIVLPEIRRALNEDNTELAMAYLPVLEWAVEKLGDPPASEFHLTPGQEATLSRAGGPR